MSEVTLRGAFEPIRAEVEAHDLEVEGTLPRGLAGTFYRIGPNPQFPPIAPYNPLQGDGMVHAFRIEGGRVGYRNRWVRTQQWAAEHAAGRALYSTGDPRRSDPGVAGRPTDGVANTSLLRHAGRLLALEEGHGPIEIDPQSLATHGRYNFAGGLPRNMTAHPKVDPVSGEMLLFANLPTGRPTGEAALFAADATGSITWSETIAGPFTSLIHDFAVTERFVVVPWAPVTISMERIRAGGPPIAWEPGAGFWLGVLPRGGTAADVRWFEGEPGMAWHVAGAFDDGGRIVVDVCEQDEAVFPRADGRANSPAAATQRLTRWTLDWDGPRRVEKQRLHAGRCEYPRIDDRRMGRPYRYAWVARAGGPGSSELVHRGLGRFDHETGAMQTWDAGPTVAVGEPVFAPAA